MEYKEISKIDYSCGCQGEIGLQETGMWETTGNMKKCSEHDGK